MAFQANSSAQNFQLENLPAQKNVLFEGLLQITYLQRFNNCASK